MCLKERRNQLHTALSEAKELFFDADEASVVARAANDVAGLESDVLVLF